VTVPVVSFHKQSMCRRFSQWPLIRLWGSSRGNQNWLQFLSEVQNTLVFNIFLVV